MTTINQYKIGEKTYIVNKLPLREAFNLRKSLLKSMTKCAPKDGEEIDSSLFFTTLIDHVVDFELVKNTVKAALYLGSTPISDSAFNKLDAADLFDVFIIIAKENLGDALTKKKSGIGDQISGLVSIITPDTESLSDSNEE